MENTNKMKNLTNDLKAFEQMMKEQHKENHYPEIEFEIDTEEDSPADILLQASGIVERRIGSGADDTLIAAG